MVETIVVINLYLLTLLMLQRNELIFATVIFILSYVHVAFFLFIVGFDFLGMIMLLLYVGAICILFIFIVMMLNIRVYTKEKVYNLRRTLILELFMFDVLLICFLNSYYSSNRAVESSSGVSFNLAEAVESTLFVHLIGEVLYTYFFDVFIISALILLLSLVGSISLIIVRRRQWF